MWEKRNNLKVIQYRVSINQHYLMSNFSSFIVFCIYFFIWKLGWLYIFKFFGTLCSSNETIELNKIHEWKKKIKSNLCVDFRRASHLLGSNAGMRAPVQNSFGGALHEQFGSGAAQLRCLQRGTVRGHGLAVAGELQGELLLPFGLDLLTHGDSCFAATCGNPIRNRISH